MEAEVIRETSKLLEDRKVVSEEEIRRFAFRAALRVLKDRLVEVGDVDIIDDVVDSLTGVPLTLNSLHYSEKVVIDDVSLYHIHTHCPTREEFEDAYVRCLEAKEFLKKVELMKRVTDSFFKGYKSRGELMREYKNDRFSYHVFYSTIGEIESDLEIHKEIASVKEGEYVVVVPTERELNDFLKFFKRHSEEVKSAGFKIWVVNTEKGTIDPFIGYPKDFRLISRFENPKIATIINSLWRPVVEELD